jgi:hypothetical protein
MRTAEKACWRQCEAVHRFNADLYYWLKSADRGVQIYQRAEKAKT